jgi:hypothetical protein
MPVSAARSRPGPVGGGAGEGALAVPEQARTSRCRLSGSRSSPRRTGPRTWCLRLLQLVDAPRELALARPGGTHQQHRRAWERTATRSISSIMMVERCASSSRCPDFRNEVPSGSSRRRSVWRCCRSARGRGRLPFQRAGRASVLGTLAHRLGLEQAPGQIARLGQQEEADLRDVRAGGDVDEVVLRIGIERLGAGMKSSSLPYTSSKSHGSLRSSTALDRPVVSGDTDWRCPRRHSRRGAYGRCTVEHHEAIDAQILVHGQPDRGPPLAPARRAELARVQRRAEESDDGERLHARYR